jgi:hypothetical protein
VSVLLSPIRGHCKVYFEGSIKYVFLKDNVVVIEKVNEYA